MDLPGPVELLIIAGVILILFGSRKMPDAARSLGRSLRIFKTEVKGLHDEDETPSQPPAQALPPVPPTPPVAPAPPVQTTPATTSATGERPDQA